MITPAPEPPFVRLGPELPISPVILSVPHAGRDYPAALLAATRLPRARLELLEDRFADRLIETAVAGGATALVARRARAWIDLNRDERELDQAMVAGAATTAGLQTPRMRGGLGLIPRRVGATGEIYRSPLEAADVAARIADDHHAWHAALAHLLAAAQARFGIAVLLDVHSMPPTSAASGIVLGDRHGGSAGARFVAAIEQEARAAGLPVVRNDPYAGGYITERHGRPAAGRHAIQLEVDRSLYLAPGLRLPGPGIERIGRFIAAAVCRLQRETEPPAMLAAE